MRPAVFSALAALAFAGCMSVPMLRPELDADAKRFEAVPGKAVVYVYRQTGLVGGAVAWPIAVNGEHLGSIVTWSYVRIELDPGRVVLSQGEGCETPTVADLAPGSITYFELDPGWLCLTFDPRKPERAQAAIRKGRRAWTNADDPQEITVPETRAPEHTLRNHHGAPR